ncbi:MAG: hypothetical protein EBT52_04670 [Flavobacteriia bacterium]|nr:hypothetical protein [Flavobacteriia bacterium]
MAYGIIDLVKALPKFDLGVALASASRSLAPAVAFAYTLGYEFGVCYHRSRRWLERRILGGSPE